MKKILITIISLFFSISILNAEDIISSAFITSGTISLGEDAKIQFNVNQVNLCDSYTISTSVNYVSKKIVVEVDYNYVSICSESSSVFTEFVDKQVLLEGFYNVEIKLNVPSNSFWDETINLSSIFVGKPFSLTCNYPFIPLLKENCPPVLNQVCACDGQNYYNECDAYLLNKNGVYNANSCSTIIEQESIPFNCQVYNNFKINKFSKYSCTDDIYEGRELYLKYEHYDNDTLIINFKSNSDLTRVFLTKIVDDNIECISISDKNKLEYPDLPSGAYYLIADNPEDFNLNINIELCVETLTNKEVSVDNLTVYPVPIDNYIGIKSNNTIKTIKIYDIFGTEKYYKKIVNSDIKINNDFKSGIYFIQIETNTGVQTKKIIVN